MVKRYINSVQDWLDDRLRTLAGRLTPGIRIIIVLSMLLVFGGLSIYITVSSIYQLGKEKGEQWHIERIKTLKLHRDSIQNEQIKNFNDE